MIHDLAHVAGAFLGGGVTVWQFASVIRGATVGAGTCIASCAVVDAADVGENCLIGHGAQIHPGAKIGHNVFVGPGAILCNDAWPRVAKDGFDSAALLSGVVVTVEIEDRASIGAGAIVLPGVKIGAGAVIAAGSTVTRSVLPAHLWKRDGSCVPISPRVPERVRRAGSA